MIMERFGLSMICFWVCYILVTWIGVAHTIFNIKVLHMKSMKESPGMGEGYLVSLFNHYKRSSKIIKQTIASTIIPNTKNDRFLLEIMNFELMIMVASSAFKSSPLYFKGLILRIFLDTDTALKEHPEITTQQKLK